jgi:hypothetical protein
MSHLPCPSISTLSCQATRVLPPYFVSTCPDLTFCPSLLQNPHPTTTLQSNVNLKRPTLSFTPIALPIGSSSSTNLYNIKFTYDCSTPTVLLSLRLHLPSPTSSNPHATTSETIWAGTLPGGFGRSWSLPQDAQLDLAAIERSLNNTNSKREEYSFDDKRTSSYSATGATTAPVLENQPTTQQTRGGGGLFGMRRGRPTQDDVEAQNTMAMQTIDLNAGASKKGEEGAKAGEPKKMVRLVIRLESRGANGEHNSFLASSLFNGTVR